MAHFLQQHFGPRVQIVVYEKGTVGGRLATISVNKQNYESGAASFHSLSLHMQDFVKLLGECSSQRGSSAPCLRLLGAQTPPRPLRSDSHLAQSPHFTDGAAETREGKELA